jgi:hypothetical protein
MCFSRSQMRDMDPGLIELFVDGKEDGLPDSGRLDGLGLGSGSVLFMLLRLGWRWDECGRGTTLRPGLDHGKSHSDTNDAYYIFGANGDDDEQGEFVKGDRIGVLLDLDAGHHLTRDVVPRTSPEPWGGTIIT